MRRLAERKHRDREGLFVTEGEDLLAAGMAAGRAPRLLLTEAGAGLGGEEVERRAARRRFGARVRFAGDRRLGAGPRPTAASPLRLPNGVRDPGNVGRDRPRRRRPRCRERRARPRLPPIRSRRRRCARAWGRCSRSTSSAVPCATRPSHGRGWERTGARGRRASARPRSAWAPSARASRARWPRRAPRSGRSRSPAAAESLGVGGRGGDRAGADIVGRRRRGAPVNARPDQRAARRGRVRDRRGRRHGGARGPAHPLPRAQVGADRDPARHRRPAAPRSAGRSAPAPTRRGRRSRSCSTRAAARRSRARSSTGPSPRTPST